MFQNDINFVFQDFEESFSVQSAKKCLERMIELHESDSESTAFLELKNGELPDCSDMDADVILDSSRARESGIIRIAVYNKYDSADRVLDDYGSIEITVEPLLGKYGCVTMCCRDGEEDYSILELESASGSSSILINIDSDSGTREFPVSHLDEAASYLASGS